MMLEDTRKQAVKAVCGELKTSEDYFKNRWLWGQKMPDEKQPIVTRIFQNALRNQNERIEKAAGL